MKSEQGPAKIDGFALTGLMVNLVSTTAVLAVPHGIIEIARQDAWMAVFIPYLCGAALIYILYRLSILFPGKTLIEYLPLIVGQLAGKLIGIGYIMFITYLAASIIRQALALFYGTGVFIFTPEFVIVILLLITTSYAVASGIEVLSRTMSFYWLGIAVIYITFMGMSIPEMKLEVLRPIGGTGFNTILKSSLLPLGYWGEFLFLAMLLPYCRSAREGYIAGNVASLLIAFFIIITVIPCIAILGTDTMARVLYAPFFLADFVQPVGIKIFLVTLWVIGFWGKIGLLQFCLTDGLSQLFGLKERGVIVLPVAIILAVFSVTFYDNAIHLFESIRRTWPGAAIIFEYLIPTLLFIIAIFKARMILQSKEGEKDQ